jgi:hypothetical protein
MDVPAAETTLGDRPTSTVPQKRECRPRAVDPTEMLGLGNGSFAHTLLKLDNLKKITVYLAEITIVFSKDLGHGFYSSSQGAGKAQSL